MAVRCESKLGIFTVIKFQRELSMIPPLLMTDGDVLIVIHPFVSLYSSVVLLL